MAVWQYDSELIMALYDTDKDSEDRGSPTPNHNDKVIDGAHKSHGTTSVNYTTDATNLTTIQDARNAQTTIVQVGTFTTIQSYATTNPGAGNYINDTFNLYQVAHGLSYIPGLVAYELSGSGQYSNMPYGNFQASAGVGVWYNFLVFVDATNVYLQLRTMTFGNGSVGFAPGFIFKWYLTQQTSN